MDASDDFGESQATQLLQNVLETGHDGSYKTSNSRSTRHAEANFSKDASTHSALSKTSVPSYNLHGLGQTQTQPAEDSEMGDSQKENLHNLRQNALYTRPPSPPQSPPMPSPSRRSGTKGVQAVQNPKSRDRKSVSKPASRTGAVAQKFPGSAPKTPNQRPTVSPPRDYSSPLTEDDFEHDSFVAQAAHQRHLAGLKQFGVPLSDLEKGTHSFTGDTDSSPEAKMNPLRRPALRGKHRRSPTPEGRVLVDATPEHSGSENIDETQPNLEGDTQPDEPFFTKRNKDDDTESDDSGPSSSYGRMLNGEYEPEEMDPTQPNTEVDYDMSPRPVPQTMTTAMSNATTGRPNILSLVNPLKQWRFRTTNVPSVNVQNDNSTQPVATQRSPSPPFRAGPFGQETQPSDIPEELANIPPRRTFPKALAGSRQVQPSIDDTPAGYQDTQEAFTPDAMDIVPDSEPMRDEAAKQARSASMTPPKSGQGSRSPYKRRKLASIEEVAATESEPEYPQIPGLRREEEEEEEEEDAPLAIRLSKIAPPARPAIQAPRFDPGITPTPYILPTRNVAYSKHRASPKDKPKPVVEEPESSSKPSKRAAQGRSVETTVVPSSVPEQDAPPAKPKTKGKATAAKPSASKGKTKRTNTRGMTKKSKGKRRRVESEDEADDESATDDEQELLPQVYREEEEEEPAEDQSIEPKLEEAGPSSRKRKRGTPASKAKTPPKGQTRLKSVLPEPPSKHLRSAAHSHLSSHPQDNATRVFAQWSDGRYFPGTVHSCIAGSTYKIVFDDSDTAIVPLTAMRKLEFRKNDDVLSRTHGLVHVNNQSRLASQGLLTVTLKKTVIDIDVKDVFLAPRAAEATAWKDRIPTAAEVVPIYGPDISNEPASPPHSTAVGTVSRNGRTQLFNDVAIVVTLGHSEDEAKRKQELERMMEQNGGIVLSDWTAVIRMEGKHSNANHRWVATKSDLSWKGQEIIRQAFLVCDQPSQKPKFLIALALGIPCLHEDWLRDSIAQKEILPFHRYLVSQGFNPTLSAMITQQVDSSWGETTSYLTDIASYNVPAKPLKTKSILCLGSDIFPPPKSKKNANDPANAMTQIILCMGAERVEAATELRYASENLHEYDYVIVKDYPRTNLSNSSNVAAWEWVKNCLTASRLNPIS